MSGDPSFVQKLEAAAEQHRSLLCIGLDPDPTRFSGHFPEPVDAMALIAWGRNLIEQTADLACCFKPNSAFYEQFGAAGMAALQETIAAVPDPIPVLLDVKRGDIGSTAAAYARAAFQVLGADAVTASPYLGRDAVDPFLAYPGKMAFLLCHTSNASAAAIQELPSRGRPLFERVLQETLAWGDAGQIGFVVGATQVDALARVRQLLGERPHWILAPGIGAQGGDLEAALAAGLDEGGSRLIVPVSRAVIYAKDPRAAAQALRDEIEAVRERFGRQGRRRAPSLPGPPSVEPVRRPVAHDELILKLHDAGCIQFGDFLLASGQRSPIYLDLRRMAGDPALLRLAAEAYADLLRPLAYRRLAAVPYAALTIGTAVALAANRPLVYPRKDAKAHGTGQVVEGGFSPGERVVVIEDLVTTAGSVLKAIDALETAGLLVSDVAVLIDREQGGPENLARAGFRLHAVLTLSEVLDALEAAGRLPARDAAAVRQYLESD